MELRLKHRMSQMFQYIINLVNSMNCYILENLREESKGFVFVCVCACVRMRLYHSIVSENQN